MGVTVKDCPKFVRIGLVADSHGSVQVLCGAIRALRARGAEKLYHLGDFSDSVYRNNLPEIISILVSEGILAIMGNNDYQIQSMLKNGDAAQTFADPRRLRRFLRQTPIIREIDSICLAHSLPYDTIRSIYEPVDDGTVERAMSIFSNTAYSAIFCGHSHMPVLFRCHAGQVKRESLDNKRLIPLQSIERYIIIVGSALKGECGIYDSDMNCYERIRI